MSNYRNAIDSGVNNVGYTIVRLAPIIAPIPALATLLDATNYALYAWFVVFGVELTGYAIGEQLVRAIRLKVLTLKVSSIPLIIYGLVIEGLMLGYKVIPAWAGYYNGQVDLSHAIQAGVGILYPFFTLAGAILFAFHEYLETVQGDEDYEKQTARQRDNTEWEDERRFKNAEREAKLAAKVSKIVSVNIAKTDVSQADTPVTDVSETSQETIEKLIVRFLKNNPGAKLETIAANVDTTKGNVSKKLTALIDMGILHEERQGNRRVVTVNGNHEQFLAS